MKKLLSILFALILTISIAGCNSGEQVPCPVVDYQTNEKDNPVNTWCKEYFKDSEKIYAIGEHSGPEERGMEMVKKISESKARGNLAKKIAELQKKIDHLVTVKTNEADSSGTSDVEIRTQTTFNINLTGVEKVVSQCIENEGNYKCYTALEMPKASAVESATASVRENNGKYRELIASEEYQKLLAEF